MMFIVASANRDEQRWDDGETRSTSIGTIAQHLTFGDRHALLPGRRAGPARSRVALEEFLARFPTWEVDWDKASLSSTSTVRGWETLPICRR